MITKQLTSSLVLGSIDLISPDEKLSAAVSCSEAAFNILSHAAKSFLFPLSDTVSSLRTSLIYVPKHCRDFGYRSFLLCNLRHTNIYSSFMVIVLQFFLLFMLFVQCAKYELHVEKLYVGLEVT